MKRGLNRRFYAVEIPFFDLQASYLLFTNGIAVGIDFALENVYRIRIIINKNELALRKLVSMISNRYNF